MSLTDIKVIREKISETAVSLGYVKYGKYSFCYPNVKTNTDKNFQEEDFMALGWDNINEDYCVYELLPNGTTSLNSKKFKIEQYNELIAELKNKMIEYKQVISKLKLKEIEHDFTEQD